MARVFKKHPQTAGRVVDGLAFVVTPHDNKLHTLNRTATLLWTLAETGCSAEAATDALVEAFEVSEETASADVQRCLTELASRGILVEENP